MTAGTSQEAPSLAASCSQDQYSKSRKLLLSVTGNNKSEKWKFLMTSDLWTGPTSDSWRISITYHFSDRTWLEVWARTLNVKCYWTVSSRDCRRLQIFSWTQRWNLYLTTTLTLNNPHGAYLTNWPSWRLWKTFCAGYCDYYTELLWGLARAPSHFISDNLQWRINTFVSFWSLGDV